jgi:hypothetical protein
VIRCDGCPAWRAARPDHGVAFVDLPVSNEESAVFFFAGQLTRLSETISGWSGQSFNEAVVSASIAKFNEMAELLEKVSQRPRGHEEEVFMQDLFNRAATSELDQLLDFSRCRQGRNCGACDEFRLPFRQCLPTRKPLRFWIVWSSIAGDSVCTGSRAFAISAGRFRPGIRAFVRIAQSARAERSNHWPGKIAEEVLAEARSAKREGYRLHPEILRSITSRLPAIRRSCVRWPAVARFGGDHHAPWVNRKPESKPL